MKQNKQQNQCFCNFSFSALRKKRNTKSRSGELQCPCIYRIELDFHLRDNAIKEMQDAIDSAGMNGQVKIFKTPNQELAAEVIKCFTI